jgi:hypothetical protein
MAKWSARIAVLGLLLAPAAWSAQIAGNTVEVSQDDWLILLDTRVYDEVDGDPSRWLFEYTLTGNYDPEPGDTNQLSSLQILFAGLVDAAGHQAPPGWLVDCCLTASPFGAGFDIPNSAGSGASIESPVVVSFTVPAGTPYTDEPSGSFAGSHFEDEPGDFVLLVDDESGRGPLVPLPEPGAIALVGLGCAALAGVSRRGRG